MTSHLLGRAGQLSQTFFTHSAPILTPHDQPSTVNKQWPPLRESRMSHHTRFNTSRKTETAAMHGLKVDHRTKISRLLGDEKQSAVVPKGCHVGDPLYGLFNSKASTACWRFCRLFLVRKLMHWWVSWGLWRKMMPTPSSTMPVARQVSSRLLRCGAKSARRAPTRTSSTPPGWGSGRSLPSLAALIWVGSMAGSPAGASMKGLFLCHVSLYSSGCRRTKTIKDGCPGLVLPGRWWHFHACLGFFGFLNKCHGWACHSVSLSDGPDPVL